MGKEWNGSPNYTFKDFSRVAALWLFAATVFIGYLIFKNAHAPEVILSWVTDFCFAWFWKG